MIVDYNPFSTDYREDPYPGYARLRAEAPVALSESSGTPMWIVSRFHDVRAVLKEPGLFSSDAVATVNSLQREQAAPGDDPRLPGNLSTYDPSEHKRLRTIVNRAFTPRRIASWRTWPARFPLA